mmetsp:Transcript_3857/g.11507  ORF Transcript_3857/g.11507 Transcript_3857/m.11507 type:complete len:511 (+) Transcript_3857:648-2180(+)
MSGKPSEVVTGDCHGGLEKYAEAGIYSTALFFAENVVAEDVHSDEDVLRLARLSFDANRIARALRLLESLGAKTPPPRFRLLTARCHYKRRDFERSLAAVGEGTLDDDLDDGNATAAGICLMRARTFEALENTNFAIKWYKEALRSDTRCFEALEHLVTHHLITQKRALELLTDVFGSDERSWLFRTYRALVVASDPSQEVFNEDVEFLEKQCALAGSPVLKYVKAARAFAGRHYQRCLKLTSELVRAEHRDDKCVLLHLAALSFGHGSELFSFSHRLEEEDSQSPLACLAIGYYYLEQNADEKAKRYLQKATMLEPRFVPAWIALGHILSSQDDNDGALATYRTAMRLMPASALPLLYSGMEYARLRFVEQAERHVKLAGTIAPWDPQPIYELGVLRYQTGLFSEGAGLFEEALRLVDRDHLNDPLLEALYLGLGHCMRRLKRFSDARMWYEKALYVSPASALTLASLGMAYHGEGNLEQAILLYHNCLRTDTQDTLVLSLLNSALVGV